MQERFERGAGILMPVSSLPSPYGIGNFGKAAYEFVDLLAANDQKYWQVLPLGPTGYGDSPYQPYSAFAGNPYFIDPDAFCEEGLLTKEEVESFQWSDTDSYVSYDRIYQGRFPLLYMAFARSEHEGTPEFEEFLKENDDAWLDDFALYCACKKYYDQMAWTDWDEDAKFHEVEILEKIRREMDDEIRFQKFMQFKFFEQWTKLKKYANDKGIEIIGDIPLYMAMDSADVWSHPELYKLDADLAPTCVAGCPPDCFSADGQLWGNPIYDWKRHEEDGFAWWKARMKSNAKLYDVIRIDHFIGIVRYFNIPAEDDNARGGWFEWGPAKKLTDAIDEAVGTKRIVAEDLGIMITEVRELIKETGYPGMKVVQFAFDGSADNDHLPYNYGGHRCIAYTGTHDNETLMGFLTGTAHPNDRKNVLSYLGLSEDGELAEALETGEISPEASLKIRRRMARVLYESTADVVILTVQDLVGVGNEARINTPSTSGDNWKWRVAPGQLGEEQMKALQLAQMVRIYGRYRG